MKRIISRINEPIGRDLCGGAPQIIHSLKYPKKMFLYLNVGGTKQGLIKYGHQTGRHNHALMLPEIILIQLADKNPILNECRLINLNFNNELLQVIFGQKPNRFQQKLLSL